jgi:spoIIIJ-associated protein
MSEKIQSIVKTLSDFLSPGLLEIDVTENDGVFVIKLKTEDIYTFVGKDNKHFDAFSHLIKKVLTKHISETDKVVIDINNLQSKQDEALKVRASIIADRARSFKKDEEFPPLTSYERRIVHAFLEGSPLIKTESVGEGKDRRLVIRYIG